MRPIHTAFLLFLALTALFLSTPAQAADPANDGARRCASVYGRVMRANAEGSAAYDAALGGRLALLSRVETREGRFDGQAVLASDEAVEAEVKGDPAKLREAVTACDSAHGQSVASGLTQGSSPHVTPAPAVAAVRPAEDRCDELDKKAAELMNTWTYRVGEIAEDPYEDKLRRLRDSYDTIHSKLEWVRDDASSYGCHQLASQISDAFTTWERP